ncbi:hypothetical protein D3C78_1151480 [compost metagenome]
MLQAGEHIARRKTQGAQQRQRQANQGFTARRMARQFRPEQQAQPAQAQRTATKDIGGDPLAEEHPGIERVPQGRGGKHHGDQPAGDPLAGSQKAHEVDAEQAKALGQADAMTAPVHRLQATAEQQNGEQDQPGQRKAIDNRHRNGDHAQLQFQGDPGGAPDQYGQQVQRQVHGSTPRIQAVSLRANGLSALADSCAFAAPTAVSRCAAE